MHEKIALDLNFCCCKHFIFLILLPQIVCLNAKKRYKLRSDNHISFTTHIPPSLWYLYNPFLFYFLSHLQAYKFKWWIEEKVLNEFSLFFSVWGKNNIKKIFWLLCFLIKYVLHNKGKSQLIVEFRVRVEAIFFE